MAAKGLGKGIDAMIPAAKSGTKSKTSAKKEKDELQGEVVVEMNINEVSPNREQPRKKFDEDALEELSESIKQHGILQPLLVEKKEDYYEIIAGERRWRAAKIAGVKKVPVIIKELTEQEKVEIALIENIQRENLNPIEEAMAYKKLLEEFNLKQDEVAQRVSKSRSAVTNSMRLLKLGEQVQQMVIDDMISTGHARALLSLEPEKQYSIAQYVFDNKMSVRDTEKYVKKLLEDDKESLEKEKAKKKDNRQMDLVYQNLADKMKTALGTKVSITPKDSQRGKIEIEYYSNAELERLMEIFTK
ncbi:ParB/RepB/Spo0J family partition protein [Eubacterium oxidoreducens]|uniref:Chromosome partitioning protein, ParB family n=1 Tax=Eubacterium oxidoreducens TaxID=1732 RepID=A0A1G6CQ59_EUBOX|nr:ParB/RepB/Spo0J family partition protein [Eubacterium oxidoreducens]SDB34942.1 chromosome partitioning protein, ParB family [Eubacterium oxidoreducens]